MTVMGDALMDGLSDRGSIPLRSIGKKRKVIEMEVSALIAFFYYLIYQNYNFIKELGLSKKR